LAFKRYCLPRIRAADYILEIGPEKRGSTPERLLREPVNYLTADIVPGRAKLDMPDPYTIPMENHTFDVVLALQVLEHVRQPWLWFPELVRVTRPGGLVMTISPINWKYHCAPVDCWRVLPHGLKTLFDVAGLSTELIKRVSLDNLPRDRKHTVGGAKPEDLVGIGKKPT
jgi:SAM-dependent methyltransferase